MGEVCYVRQVKGDDPDEMEYDGPQGCVWVRV
jgi:hypothetical protein